MRKCLYTRFGNKWEYVIVIGILKGSIPTFKWTESPTSWIFKVIFRVLDF